MELQVIPLASMWPDPNNPRKDFGDLDALADTFEMNVVRPFEPVNPPTVVPDGVSARGHMFRIVDGERRWRAMTKRGAVESCAAIVCSMDEANAMAAMVAALYAVMSYFGNVFGLTYGPIQLRFSEALCVLPFLFPSCFPCC